MHERVTYPTCGLARRFPAKNEKTYVCIPKCYFDYNHMPKWCFWPEFWPFEVLWRFERRPERIDSELYSDRFCSYLVLVWPMARLWWFLGRLVPLGDADGISTCRCCPNTAKNAPKRGQGPSVGEKGGHFRPFLEGVAYFGVNFRRPNCVRLTRT